MQVKTVLGVRVDLVNRDEVLALIEKWIGSEKYRPRIVATAYSEFFVRAAADRAFRMALESSDLVIPDGIGPLAAVNFNESLSPSDKVWRKLVKGLMTGAAVLSRKVGRPVAGYDLFKELTRRAVEKDWRVFLLGGFRTTAAEVKEKLIQQYGVGLRVEAEAGSQAVDAAGEADNEIIIEEINRFKPDLLFVAYGPGKQEKWLAANRDRIRAKVAMGVGGTFDEYLGKVKEAPEVWSRLGLKWFWRLIQQPRRIGRIWRAVVVFPWLVFTFPQD